MAVAQANRCKTRHRLRWDSVESLFKTKLKLRHKVKRAEELVNRCKIKLRLKTKLAKVPRNKPSLKHRHHNNQVSPLNKCKCRIKPNKELVSQQLKTKHTLRPPIGQAQTANKCKLKARMLMTGLKRVIINATIEKFTF